MGRVSALPIPFESQSMSEPDQGSEFPKAVYRAGKDIVQDGVSLDYDTVANADEQAEALASGWYLHPSEVPEKSEKTLLDKSAKDIKSALPDLSLADLEALKADETAGKSRSGVLADIDAAIDAKLKD